MNAATAVENSMVFLKNNCTELREGSPNSTCGILEKNGKQELKQVSIYIAVCTVIICNGQIWEPSKYPLMDVWIQAKSDTYVQQWNIIHH